MTKELICCLCNKKLTRTDKSQPLGEYKGKLVHEHCLKKRNESDKWFEDYMSKVGSLL